MSDVRVCERDGSPLVFTLEFPGAEFVCVECGGTEGLFGRRVAATTELEFAHQDALDRYAASYLERQGRPLRRDPRQLVGDPGVVTPVCGSCGREPLPGTALEGGKPPLWYSRERDGQKEYACSRECIPQHEAILPW